MNAQERRSVVRWQVDRPATVKLGGSQNYAAAQVKDINFKGMQFSLGLRLPKDAFANFQISLAEELVLDVEAWVVWHKAIDGHNVYGVYFAHLKDKDKEKIYKFIRRFFPQYLDKQWILVSQEEKGGENMETKFKDRRIFQRFTVQLATLFLNLVDGKECQAHTRDVSAKGIGLISNEDLPADTPLELWLSIPDKGDPLYFRGNVVWSERLEPDKYRIGVNLEKADLMGLSRVLRAS